MVFDLSVHISFKFEQFYCKTQEMFTKRNVQIHFDHIEQCDWNYIGHQFKQFKYTALGIYWLLYDSLFASIVCHASFRISFIKLLPKSILSFVSFVSLSSSSSFVFIFFEPIHFSFVCDGYQRASIVFNYVPCLYTHALLYCVSNEE